MTSGSGAPRPSPRGRLLVVGYVATVAALAAASFSDPQGQVTRQEVAVLLLTLPAVAPLLPVLYVAGATAWNLTGAAEGSPMWPVTVTYTLVFVGIAVANAWLVTTLLRTTWRRLRRVVAGRRTP